ncbi:hypothetical protein RRG08_042844 [Elysia crispata]|uniref:C-type lectin domain-containing protein n=1 Tax=Elysia crispata TaxID=231223 RepID=A0AAE1AHV6_9GAST|nr:hypothetical protein RRG08_042844 [Elysia crispata]
MSRQPLLLWLTLVFALGKGTLFDFHVIPTRQRFQSGQSLCRGLDYDGLAVVSSPEMFRYALKLTKPLRKPNQSYGLYVGLRKNPLTDVWRWDDGSPSADDSPWFTVNGSKPTLPLKYGVISAPGELRMSTGIGDQMALCGYHRNLPTEAHGTTLRDHQPDGVSSSLSVNKVPSYLECVLLCGRDYRSCYGLTSSTRGVPQVTVQPATHGDEAMPRRLSHLTRALVFLESKQGYFNTMYRTAPTALELPNVPRRRCAIS